MFKLSFKRQVLTGFAASLVFVVIAVITAYTSIKSLLDSTSWIEHTYEVIGLAEKSELELVNAETGVRGFVITQKNAYKDPYIKSINQVNLHIEKLKELVKDNPAQAELVDSLEFYAKQKVDDMKNVMSIATSFGKEAAMNEITKNNGLIYKINFLRINHALIKIEHQLLQERKLETKSYSARTITVVFVAASVIFLLILLLLRYIRTTFDHLKQTEIKILANNDELSKLSIQNEHQNWLLTGAAQVNQVMQGEQDIPELTTKIISKICNYVHADIGAMYMVDERKHQLYLTGAFAYKISKSQTFKFGEGLLGQVALEKQPLLIKDIPEDYIKVKSALGNALPTILYITPIIFENKTIAVLELGFLKEPDENKLQLIKNILENIGIALNSAIANVQLKELFAQTQQQAEELEAQQEELRTTNEELQASEEELKVQQEELQQNNAELEEKAQLLEQQNISIEQAREAISAKALELELSSKYKSEFLANMSHELRTPLNSILILARILKDNKPANLNEDQVKYAGVIQNAGTDLLNLINDILDLSKIESGIIDLNIETIKPETIKRDIEELFREVANNKAIEFNINLDHSLPQAIQTDISRLEQIIKNLLSNAFKFTSNHGQVDLNISEAPSKIKFSNPILKNYTDSIIAIEVKDNGIGIRPEKQKVIFEAFQQEDGSTSRRYGGTGLGLSISKELANILGGEIQIKSEHGIGSTFTLYIPQKLVIEVEANQTAQIEELPTKNETITFAKPLQVGDEKNTLLIVEDDLNFAEILKDYATEKGFTPIMAHSGDTGLELAISKLPDAIILDIMLPVMDGWTILKKLKNNPITKHIPVHMMSAGDEKVDKAKKEGAIGFLKKPIGEKELDHAFSLLKQIPIHITLNKVLLIEDQEMQSKLLTQQLKDKGVEVSQAFEGETALKLLKQNNYDCIILDLNLPDISGFDLLDQIKTIPALQHIPVVINTAMELSKEQMARIMLYSEAMVLKSDKSNDRLIDEVSLFMNKLKSDTEFKPTKSNKLTSTLEKVLKDKKILVTDDDMRNIFAISTALQVYDMQIVIANNGKEALQKLSEHQDVDLVLMDIMMPEMDGYEAMQKIRANKQFTKLPIIALTAKAMKNDREKCIEAGANDYIAKPIDLDKLMSMMRVWLSN